MATWTCEKLPRGSNQEAGFQLFKDEILHVPIGSLPLISACGLACQKIYRREIAFTVEECP